MVKMITIEKDTYMMIMLCIAENNTTAFFAFIEAEIRREKKEQIKEEKKALREKEKLLEKERRLEMRREKDSERVERLRQRQSLNEQERKLRIEQRSLSLASCLARPRWEARRRSGRSGSGRYGR